MIVLNSVQSFKCLNILACFCLQSKKSINPSSNQFQFFQCLQGRESFFLTTQEERIWYDINIIDIACYILLLYVAGKEQEILKQSWKRLMYSVLDEFFPHNSEVSQGMLSELQLFYCYRFMFTTSPKSLSIQKGGKLAGYVHKI